MNNSTNETLTAVYGEMELSNEEFYALTDRSLAPRPSGMLADKLAELGIGFCASRRCAATGMNSFRSSAKPTTT